MGEVRLASLRWWRRRLRRRVGVGKTKRKSIGEFRWPSNRSAVASHKRNQSTRVHRSLRLIVFFCLFFFLPSLATGFGCCSCRRRRGCRCGWLLSVLSVLLLLLLLLMLLLSMVRETTNWRVRSGGLLVHNWRPRGAARLTSVWARRWPLGAPPSSFGKYRVEPSFSYYFFYITELISFVAHFLSSSQLCK